MTVPIKSLAAFKQALQPGTRWLFRHALTGPEDQPVSTECKPRKFRPSRPHTPIPARMTRTYIPCNPQRLASRGPLLFYKDQTMWTPERIATLKALWAKGQSASEMAAELGALSRNAVIGKLHRLGLKRPKSTLHPKKRPTRTTALSVPRAAVPKSLPLPAFKADMFPPLARAPDQYPSTATLTPDHCRWPEGDPKSSCFHYCGRPRAEDSPYCPHHRARATTGRRADISDFTLTPKQRKKHS